VRGSLWYRVLSARFTEDGSILHAEGEGVSVWWSNLVKISHGVGTTVGRSWIDDNFVCELGGETSILFWWEGFEG